jgi:UDP-2,3-diacylglucosamine pyrophosphatase LpxH
MNEVTSDQGSVRRDIRAAFVSDVHLGSRYCHAERFLSFLEQHQVEQLYLVGDIIDGWCLRRSWRWPGVYHRILNRLLEMTASGTRLYYAPGNHDAFLRHYLKDYGFVDVADEFVHTSLDRRRFLVTHGDQFDAVEGAWCRLSRIGSSAYEFLMWTNHIVNRLRRMVRLDDCRYSHRLKLRVKSAVRFISDFETSVAQHARKQACQAVICGHIHAPTIQMHGEIEYCNTGDWVENCTALLENSDGTWEIVQYPSQTSIAVSEAAHGQDLLQHVGRGTGPRRPSRRTERELAATA